MTIVSKVTVKFTLTAPIVSLRNERTSGSYKRKSIKYFAEKTHFHVNSAILNRPALGECEAKAAH